MYRLDLDDPRLNLPVAVYRSGDGRLQSRPPFGLGHRPAEMRVAFFAKDREGEGTVPIVERLVGDRTELRVADPGHPAPIFHALPADLADPPPGTTPLFAYQVDSGEVRYATEADAPDGSRQVGEAICRVWRRPGPERQPLFP
jgi:hypothetical protein